jgi:RNA polymerase sigma-70 factor (ECF subfamily)
MVFGRRSKVADPKSPGTPGVGVQGEDRAFPAAPVEDAFSTEALSYIDALYGTALRLTRRPQDAEDLVQDTYLKAFRASSQFQRGTNLKAWLFTILHNTFRNMRRHDGRNPVEVNSETVEQAADLRGDETTPEQLLTRATLDSDLQAALDDLPDAFRQAVWLRDVEEFSYADIAKIVDVPIGTVMSRISRGRRMLYERLAPKRGGATAHAASG